MRPSNHQIPLDEFVALERDLDRAVQLPLVVVPVPTHIRETSATPFPAPAGVAWR